MKGFQSVALWVGILGLSVISQALAVKSKAIELSTSRPISKSVHEYAVASFSPFAKSKTKDQSLTVSLHNIDLGYNVVLSKGKKPRWMPTLVLDNGHKTFIRFPKAIYQSEALVLKVDQGNGQYASTVGYHLQGQYMIIDGLFRHARLVINNNRNHTVVQLNKLGESYSS